MDSELVYTSESEGISPRFSPVCRHGVDAGMTCYPCDFVDINDGPFPSNPADFSPSEISDATDEEMERWLWFGSPEDPIL